MVSLFADIEPFLAVAEHGSFRAAASRLRLTPPAVSKAIARLEARLGTSLFSRTTRRVALTAEGEAFLERCRAAAREIEAGQGDLARTRETMTGEMVVTAPFIFGRFLAARLPGLIEPHPGLGVRLVATDRRVDLLAERVDVAIRVGDPGEADLVVRRLAGLRWVMVASPDYLRRNGTPRSAGDLAAHRHLRFVPPSGNPVALRLRDGELETDVAAAPGMVVDQGELLVDAALSGGGIAQVFSFMVAGHLRDGSLVPVLSGAQPAGPDLNAVLASRREISLRMRRLLDFLYGCFREL